MKILQIASLLVCISFLTACTFTTAFTGESTLTPKEQANDYYYEFDDILIPRVLKINLQRSYSFETSTFKTAVLSFDGEMDGLFLVHFFLENMNNDGWKRVSFVKGERSFVIFEKPTRSCSIIFPDEKNPELMIIAVEKLGAAMSTPIEKGVLVQDIPKVQGVNPEDKSMLPIPAAPTGRVQKLPQSGNVFIKETDERTVFEDGMMSKEILNDDLVVVPVLPVVPAAEKKEMQEKTLDKSDKAEKSNKSDKAEKSNKSEKAEKSDKSEKSAKTKKSEKSTKEKKKEQREKSSSVVEDAIKDLSK